jgi:hypothetical protein
MVLKCLGLGVFKVHDSKMSGWAGYLPLIFSLEMPEKLINSLKQWIHRAFFETLAAIEMC